MPLREEPYKWNQGVLKNYGGLKYKLVHFKVLRTSGLELPETKGITLARGEANDDKLENNISRAKATVMELAMCNPWDYWMTLTLDPKKYDRTNLQIFRKDFTRWLRNLRSRHGYDIKYLLIPELHQDGKSWHMHGFISGLPIDQLRLFDVFTEKLPPYIVKKRNLGYEVYDWPSYRFKFGFVDVEPIRSRDACSKYVTKYISKELDKTIQDLEANLYYCSQGLRRAEVMKKGTMVGDLVPDFENDYVRVQWFDANQDLASLTSMIAEPINNFKPRQLSIKSLLR